MASRIATGSCLVALVCVSIASAQTATFNVDQTGSSLAFTGTAFGQPIQQQGPGSTTTTYHGTINVQLTPGSINLPGGSQVIANNSGSWQPMPGGIAGSAPANYGGQVTIPVFGTGRAAVRNAVFDGTTSPPLALSGGNSATFTPDILFAATAGDIDYNAPIAGVGSDTIAGDSANNTSPNPGTLNIVAGPAPGGATATLTVPVDFMLVVNVGGVGNGEFNFDGSIRATRSTIGGDTNFDGSVNLADFNTLASSFGQSTGQSWLSGDFTFDGNVNLSDFNVLAANFGLSASSPGGPTAGDWKALSSAVSAAIPEPALMLPVAALAAGSGLRIGRQRQATT
jgi:hypothetical protein